MTRMTEAKWLRCNDPEPMLEFLRGRASDRKLRLFACGYCRFAGHAAMDEVCRRALEVAERYADGDATADDLADDWVAVAELRRRRRGIMTPWERWWGPVYGATAPVIYRSGDHPGGIAWEAARVVALGASDAGGRSSANSDGAEVQAALLRCLFANPFRSAAVAPPVLRWNDGTVGKIAQSIYEGHAFERLPILADALEDAGCDDADILTHCRGPNVHVRGCWVVDLLLDKN
jgi:hypothetical protein